MKRNSIRGAEAEAEEEAAEGVDINVDAPPRQVVSKMHADRNPTSARSGRVIRSKYEWDGSRHAPANRRRERVRPRDVH